MDGTVRARARQPDGGRKLQASELGGISPDVLSLALRAVQCGVASGDLHAPPTLTVIDYSRPSVEPRLWVYDLKTGKLLFKELVAHGRNTGENMATRFSDAMNSHQSSLGLFVTSDTYVGNNGYSLRLDGLEPGVNARARERAIVMHGAPYVDAKLAESQGRLGRSWGCPALREAVARERHQYDPGRRRDLLVLSRRALAENIALPERLRRRGHPSTWLEAGRPRHLVRPSILPERQIEPPLDPEGWRRRARNDARHAVIAQARRPAEDERIARLEQDRFHRLAPPHASEQKSRRITERDRDHGQTCAEG